MGSRYRKFKKSSSPTPETLDTSKTGTIYSSVIRLLMRTIASSEAIGIKSLSEGLIKSEMLSLTLINSSTITCSDLVTTMIIGTLKAIAS